MSTREQTTANQRCELERAASRLGHEVIAIYEDFGISGSKGRDRRPQFDALCKDAAKGKFEICMAWSVDRLGRSMIDLLGFLQHLHATKTELYLHQQAIDTSVASGKAMFGLMSVFAEFEKSLIVERVNAGIKRSREHGTKSGKPHGRPPTDPKKVEAIKAARAAGESLRTIAAKFKVSAQTVANLAAAA